MIDIKHFPQPKLMGSNKKKLKAKVTTDANLMKIDKNENVNSNNGAMILSSSGKKGKIKKASETKKTIGYKDYSDLENSKLIISYGPQIYEYSRTKEQSNCINKDDEQTFNLLKNHEITPQIRTKLVDWLYEVMYAYKCEESCFYLTFHIMDSYIHKLKAKLTNNDIHLIGVTSLFIASKSEDMSPLDLLTVKTKIGHNKFSEKDIKKKERQILELLDFNILFTSTSDFIRNFIYDFSFNNSKVIVKLKMKTQIEMLEETAIYISKVILHSEVFSGYRSSLKAIASIIVAYDLLRSNVITFTKDIENFTHEWIAFLIDQSRFNPNLINDVYNQITDYFNKFDKVPLIQHNLKKNISLPF